jgi:hypothetical protein
MKTLERRVQRLESRCGTTAPVPWEMFGWEQLSDAEMVGELERYVATYPDSTLARKWRAIETLSDSELEDLLAAAEALLGEPLSRRWREIRA